MPRFSLTFEDFTTSTAFKTILLINADGTGERAEVQEVIVTGSGMTAPADTAHTACLQRLDTTGAGTGTSQTPEEMDPQGAAAAVAGVVNYSAEPTTYQGNPVVRMGFNQKGGMRWAVPRGFGVLIHNAVAAASKAAVKIKSSAAGKVEATMIWEEA